MISKKNVCFPVFMTGDLINALSTVPVNNSEFIPYHLLMDET